MLEMPSTDKVVLKESTCDLAEARRLIEGCFSGVGYFLAETTREACLDHLVSVESYLTHETTSLRCFNETKEIWLEKEPGAEHCLLRQFYSHPDGEEYHYLEHEYLLRKTSAIKIPGGGSGKSSLVCREYYRCDDDGLAQPAGNRLTGIVTREGE